MVVVDRFSQMAHFYLVVIVWMLLMFVKLYFQEIVRLHGVSHSIVSDDVKHQLETSYDVHKS